MAGLLFASLSTGCGAAGSPFGLLGMPLFRTLAPGVDSGGGLGPGGPADDMGDDRTPTDPCSESENRKFIRISMRNLAPNDFIHYFLILIAFVDGDVFEGAVCPDDVGLYTSFGYRMIAEGNVEQVGNFCIPGPSLLYFHEGGRFRRPNGELASAIAPAMGSQASFDSFFTGAGQMVPVPDIIMFHNPGTGEGAALKISRSQTSCFDQVDDGDGICRQDAFYYVDEQDLLAGSNALGSGSGRRVANEVQGTGCECAGVAEAWATLAPSGVRGSAAQCNEFLRGGTVSFAFVRDDTNPPFPQLLWRVVDESGSTVHDFDPRGNVPP